ncbi:MAG: chromate transporter [Victivallaceae bacterium]|nr:chromate transporter [Victivallaceae bacterium]
MSLWAVFLVFAKFGLLCFGGGYVLVPLIADELVIVPGVENYGVLTPEMFGNLLAIAQMTPGPIGLNTATFVGYLSGMRGFGSVVMGCLGGAVGSAGLLFPGFVLVILASYYLHRCRDSFVVRGLLTGLRPASVALIFMAVVIFLGMSAFDGRLPFAEWTASFWGGGMVPDWPELRWGGVFIVVSAMLTLAKWRVNVIYLMLAAGVLGAFICR